MLVRDLRRFSLVLGSAILLLLLCVRLVGPAGTETLLGLQVGDWPDGGSPTSPHVPSYTSPFAVASPSALEAAAALQQQQQQQSALLTDGSKDDEAPLLSSSPPPPQQPPPPSRPSGPSRFIGPNGEIVGFSPPAEVRPGGSGVLHTEIFSVSTRDRQYFPIRMGSAKVLNPNIIPHPRLESAWIVTAQKRGDHDDDDEDTRLQQGGLVVEPSLELVCNAMFIDDALTCIGADGRGFGEPTAVPILPTSSGDVTRCTGELEFFNLNVGPHDARVFYGPRDPYTIYGSNSNFNCFGQWIQDFRGLVPDWGVDVGSTAGAAGSFAHEFAAGTELQRPPPLGAVEKNWFLFWDSDNVHYVHYDITPSRAFARLNSDGSVGEDLAHHTAARDGACLARYLPDVSALPFAQAQQGPGFHESVHQATNSLSVTLCRRADPGCVADDTNTFIFAVVHHKVYRDFHSVYEPYVVVFRQRAPFEMFAVSSKPVWISGRGTVRGTGARADTTEMFYVTSIAWKTEGLKYHGYVDDVLFLAFGIEDERAAGIDVQAGSLLANLGLCDDGDGGVSWRG